MRSTHSQTTEATTFYLAMKSGLNLIGQLHLWAVNLLIYLVQLGACWD